ncbi:MAG TPA: RNA polymerase sigma factor [Candidatus Paceibacterota bacterium]|nr:RNA polymerase sigma factor [Verrucomicrobiota bacterium]HSA11319.1 RNA polymerase sigma factor [Candidatus Paceibacterota bacterium]
MREAAISDADRFLALLKPIERELETYCRRLIWEPQEAPDALQNAVLRAFKAFDRYHEYASFRAWMFKILTHEAFALNRKHARIARHEFQLEPEELAELPLPGGPDRDGGQPLSATALDDTLEPPLAAGLKALTDTERAVLLLRAIGDLRYREISESLGIPLGSVMGNLARARQKMRACLERAERRTALLKESQI